MRVSFLVYGVLYVVLEMVGYQLDQVGWAHVSALDVATAVTDALLTVAIAAAVVLALHLGLERWRRSMADWHERAAVDGEVWDGTPDPSSWRRAPITVTAERVEEPPKRSWRGNPYAYGGHRYPKDAGTLL
ncbi:UNVERIFIED_ORG: hypothetical protein E4P37_08245 [Bacillus sp. AZ43]